MTISKWLVNLGFTGRSRAQYSHPDSKRMSSTPEETASLIGEPPTEDDSESLVEALNHKSSRKSLGAFRSILFPMLSVIVGFLVGILSGWQPRENMESLSSSKMEFVPRMPTATVRFEHIKELLQPPSPESDRYWNSLMPPGKGFVTIENYEDFDLQPGITTSTGNDSFLVSMYHQLHCVALMRKNYFELIDIIRQDLPQAEQQEIIASQLANNHPHHCISYLAQGILCSADMTVEWAVVEEDGSRMVAGGDGVPHRDCKDIEAVWSWMMKHYAPPKPGRTGDITE